MTANLREPVELAFVRRGRSSTAKSIGLDYSSCNRVDEDILYRIRALLISRNDTCPPRTPHASDEHQRYTSVDSDTSGDKFDFSTAKSVARVARSQISRRLRGTRGNRSNTDDYTMDSGASQRLPEPKDSITKQLTLRNTSSAKDLKSLIDDAKLHETILTCCPPCEPEKRGLVGLSKFSLKCKTDPDYTSIRSCLEVNPQPSKPKERSVPRVASFRGLTNDSMDKRSPIFAGRMARPVIDSIQPEPADFACFMAGCSPGPAECRRHRRRSSQPPTFTKVKHVLNSDIDAIARGIAEDVIKLSIAVKDTKSQGRSVGSSHNRHTEASRSSPGRQDSPTLPEMGTEGIGIAGSDPDCAKFPGRRDSFTIPEIETETVQANDPILDRIKSPALSAASSDAFPHVMTSREAEAMQPLSATIVTNFSLPGPRRQKSQSGELNGSASESKQDQPLNFVKAKFPENSLSSKATNEPSALIRSKESRTSINSKPKSPSLLSGASRTSTRHALLKPSITSSSPVDTGLPIPPVLTQSASGETSKPDEGISNGQKKVSPAAAHLATLQKAKDLVSGVEDKIREASETLKQDMNQNSASSTVLVAGEISVESGSSPKMPVDLTDKNGAGVETPITAPVKSAEVPHRAASPNAVYWGFVPAVDDAVQNAVQVAVKKAVQEVALPPGTETGKAAEAYRRLVRDSLAQAAQNADEYLRRASLWDNLTTTQQAVDAELVATKPQKADGENIPKSLNSSASQPNDNYGSDQRALRHFDQRGSASLNENQEPRSVDAKLEHMGTVPLGSVHENVVEKDKQGWKIWNKGSSPAYSAIPTRNSSRKHIVQSKISGKNSSAIVSLMALHSPNRMKASKAKAVRSVSSLGSLHSNESTRERGTKRGVSSEGMADAIDSGDVLVKASADQKLGRKNTVHWLRELLTNEGPYEPRLTDLPPRTRRDQSHLSGRCRSRTAPSISVAELFVGATPKPAEQPQLLPQTLKGISAQLDIEPVNKQAAISETFTKTIKDLENLLNEALFIARQAADKEDAGYVPRLLGNATAVLRGGRKGFEDDNVAGRNSRVRDFSTSYSSRQSDNGSDAASLRSVHESCKSYSGSSDSEMSDVDHTAHAPPIGQGIPQVYFRPPTIAIVSTNVPQTSRESGWPPTGRHLTPFPPASATTSQRASANTIAPSYIQDEGNRLSSSAKAIADSEGQRSLLNDTLDDASIIIDDGQMENMPNDRVRDVNPFNSQPNTSQRTSSSRVSPGEVRSRAGATPACRKSQNVNSNCIDDHELGDYVRRSDTRSLPMPPITPRLVSIAGAPTERRAEYDQRLLRGRNPRDSVPSKREVREHITTFHHPPIQPRISSLDLKKKAEKQDRTGRRVSPNDQTCSGQSIDQDQISIGSQVPPPAGNQRLNSQPLSTQYTQSFDGMSNPSDVLDFETGYGHKHNGAGTRMVFGGTGAISENGIIALAGGEGDARQGIELKDIPSRNSPQQTGSRRRPQRPSPQLFNLKGRSHVSLRGEHHKGFSLTRSHKRQAIARDWAPARKRFVASVACISTALVGILLGIYGAEVPAIQYYIVDLHHYTILGNVFFFIGLAISTFFFWPLPLLHGRKPYILGSMCLAMPLLFPQALAVGDFRSPYVAQWRVALLLPRAIMGFVLGFANMNFKSTLTDLFGASLQSANPHQEVVDENDVRRHGGGLGVWLGIWTWCSIASGGIGFLIGAIIINNANPAWGFYISICIIAVVLLLNVVCPEVRRSAFRRSVAEVRNGDQVSRRLARGEVKMHMVQSGPTWWGQEFLHGAKLSASMLRQPGFLVLALYVGWIYGQIVLIVVLLGSLMSKYYQFKSPYIGASVAAVPLGALLSVPFQKAGLLSRDRTHAEISDDDTRDKKVGWSSHLVRRAIFVLCLPFAGLAYTLSSNGPPIPFILPILFAALIGFLSNLGLAECHGIIMETFDTSDLQPGMTGRPRRSNNDCQAGKRTNYSSFPRVTSAFAITQGIGYLVGAVATGIGGVAERHIGQQAATGVMAGILLILSFLLLGVLVRFREVQIIPDMHKAAMERYMNARRASATRRGEANIQDEDIRPVIIGNPTHLTRRMCILEMGSLSRWTEIRKKNHLVDQNSLEAKHPNLAVMRDVEERIKAKEQELVQHVRRSLSREGSRRSKLSAEEQLEGYRMGEQGDLGGHREMMSGSGNGLSRGGTERSRGRRRTTIRE